MPIRKGDGTGVGSIRLGDGTGIAEVRKGDGTVVFSAADTDGAGAGIGITWESHMNGEYHTANAGGEWTDTTGMQKRWEYNIEAEGDATGAPAVDTDTGYCYASTTNGGIAKINILDGTVEWDNTLSYGIATTPQLTADGDMLYVGTDAGRIYEVFTNNGTANYINRSGGGFACGPHLVNGVLYYMIQDTPSIVEAFDIATESVIWSYTANNYMYRFAPAVVGGDAVYFGDDEDYVYALNISDGTEKWVVNADTAGWSDENLHRFRCGPTYDEANNQVLFPSNSYYVHAVDASNGTLNWEYNLGDFNQVGGALKNGKFIASQDYGGNTLHAINTADGSEAWTQTVQDGTDSYPIIGGDKVVHMGDNGTIDILNISDGSFVSQSSNEYEFDNNASMDPTTHAIFTGLTSYFGKTVCYETI